MEFDLTSFSKKEWDYIAENEISPSGVADYFYTALNVRRFSEILISFSGGKDPKEFVVNKLSEYNKDVSRDSIRKKVGNWLNNKNVPTDRGELIKLCFALELDEHRANAFMRFTSDGGFHMRNPSEIAYLYCLRVKKGFIEASEFIKNLKPVDFSKKNDAAKITYTKQIRDAFADIYDDSAFMDFYADNYESFGNFHNTAYSRFMHFFNELINPDVPLYAEKEEEFSISEAVGEYLRMNLPLDKETTKYDVIRKMLRAYWPNETSVKNMRAGKIDISRKVLLLLYIVTEGYGVADYDDFSESPTPLELLEEHSYRLNLMLDECGMSMLDPRNPFDWLVLYSLKTGGDDPGMSGSLQTVLEILFSSAA